MNVLSLCSGVGGTDLALESFGHETVGCAEIDPDAIAVFEHHWPGVKNYGDVKLADWSGIDCDVLTAGYPCQPFSLAGKQLGENDERHLWPWVIAAIRELRPRVVYLENVRAHIRCGFDTVLGDLARAGFDARWGVYRSSEVGAPHQRARLYVVAHSHSHRRPRLEERDQRTQGGLAAPFGHDAERRDVPDAHAHGSGSLRRGPAGSRGRDEPADGGEPAAHSDGAGPEGREPEEGHELPTRSDLGRYEPAVRRWEAVHGPAPEPLRIGPRGGRGVSPAFVEWMMGYPPGHVTDRPLSNGAMLRVLGNSVQPQVAMKAWIELGGEE